MKPTNQDIEQLLVACKNGNQQAQLEVYNRYYHAMYNTSFRIVRNSFEAEDIMQESFLTAFNKLDTLKEAITFGVWLKRIVVNRSIQHYNKLKANKELGIDKSLYKLKLEYEVHEPCEETTKKAQLVLNNLNLLKENYRMGLTLHLIEGYDYEEISEIMNISPGNCRTLISRAKESLRSRLQPIMN